MFERDKSVQEKTLAEYGFYWREAGGCRALVCGPLEEAGFVNAFSTRLGGVSSVTGGAPADLNLAGYGEDSADNIGENRRRFLSLLGTGYSLTTAWQVHGDSIKLVQTPEDAARTEEHHDALASRIPRLLVGVKTADCVPVLIGDPANGAYAAVHAGWRGTADSIVEKTVARMIREFGTRPAGLVAAIGPAASGRSYEIGQDVIDAFAENIGDSDRYFTPTRPGHALVDLHAANRDQLLSAGVAASNIFTAPFCTMERTDLFFSYRVEKKRYGKTGRLMSVIGRRV